MIIKAIIFDMDGVLVDSVESNFKSFNMVLKKYNVKLNLNESQKYIGRALSNQIEMWKKDFNIKEEIDPQEFSKEAFQYQMKLIRDELKPDEDILNLINSSKDKGIKIAVATSSTKFRAEEILKLLNIYDKLDAFVTKEDVSRHKPAPDTFLKASSLLNINPKNCVVIEDATNGIEAANLAEMFSIAKLTKYHTKEDFESIADYIFEDFSEITIEKLIEECK